MVRYYSILVIHIALVLLAFLTPFYIDWKIVTLGCVFYSVLGGVVHYCPLTIWQFGSKKEGFWEFYLKKFNINVSKKMYIILPRYLIPFLLALFSYILQSTYNYVPFLI